MIFSGFAEPCSASSRCTCTASRSAWSVRKWVSPAPYRLSLVMQGGLEGPGWGVEHVLGCVPPPPGPAVGGPRQRRRAAGAPLPPHPHHLPDAVPLRHVLVPLQDKRITVWCLCRSAPITGGLSVGVAGASPFHRAGILPASSLRQRPTPASSSRVGRALHRRCASYEILRCRLLT